MERKRALKPATELVKYKKIGGGSLRIDGMIIKPHQIVLLNPNSISPAFAKSLQCMEPDKLADVEGKEAEQVDQTIYEMRPKTAAGWFGVFRVSDDKEMTAKSLKEEQALQLIKALNKGE